MDEHFTSKKKVKKIKVQGTDLQKICTLSVCRKTIFDKLADVEKVCKKPHFRPEAVCRYCEREKRRLICNTKY